MRSNSAKSKGVRRLSLLTVCVTTFWTGGAALCQEAVVTAPVVNVRSGPGTNHEILARAKKDDRFPILDAKGNWVQVEIGEEKFEEIRVKKSEEPTASYPEETWIFRKLVKIMGKPPDFEERQIAFQNWALDEIPVTFIEFKSDWQIWVRLPPDKYASTAKVRQIAREMAREYKRQTGFMERTVVIKVLKGNRIYATGSE